MVRSFLLSLAAVASIPIDAQGAAIIVGSGNNPGTDGTAIFEIVDAVALPAPETEIFATLPETSMTSGAFALSLLKTVDVSGTNYVSIAFAINEPGSNPGDDWGMSTFSLSVGATVVYSLAAADPVTYNPTGIGSTANSPGNIDGYVLIPESLFQGKGFALTDTFSITGEFTDLGNAGDRLVLGDGASLDLGVVPEPSSACFLALAVFVLRLRRRRYC